MTETLKYALYARKSTEGDDRQVQSIKAQVTELKEIAKKHKFKIAKVYQESKSAKNPNNRPLFTEMINDIEQGKLNGILVWQINRLSRNPAESGMLQQLLQDEKLKHIQTYDKSYYPEDNAVLLGVESSISNQFIRDLRKNVKRGIREKARNGGISGPAPEGYLNDRFDKTIIIDPERFNIIQKALLTYHGGDYSIADIVKMLDEWGYKKRQRKNFGGTGMSQNNVRHMLTNPRYAGLIPDPYEDGVFHQARFPRMISPEQYEYNQFLLGRVGRSKYKTKQHFELRGLLKCGECGCSITAEKHNKKLVSGEVNVHVYYHCTRKRGDCIQQGIKESELFNEVESLLSEYEISPELYKWGLEAIKQISHEEIRERDDIQVSQFKSIKAVQAKLDRLLDLVTREIIGEEEYISKSKALKMELSVRQNEQTKTSERIRNWYEIVGDTLSKLNNAGLQFKNGDISVRRDILLAIGCNPVLMDRTITITPNRWLLPIKNILPIVNAEISKVRTVPQQIEEDKNERIIATWYTRLDSN